MMKDGKVKFQYKLHRAIAYMDKNVSNAMDNKYLLTLGYDDRVQDGNIVETALVFKIWDFICLDNYQPYRGQTLTGGSIFERASERSEDAPISYRIQIDGKDYLGQLQKFAVSRDLVLAALVTHDSKIYVYKVLETNSERQCLFSPQAKFNKEAREFKLPEAYKKVIDLFIFKEPNQNYSMYVVSDIGILCFENIDRKDRSHVNEYYPVSNDLGALTIGAIDCSAQGQILYDFKSQSNQHSIKCFKKKIIDEKYCYTLDGEKKFLKFFNNYVVEVKRDKNQEKIQIYDFNNKLSLFNAAFSQIYQVEVESDAIFLHVLDKNGRLAVYELTEMEHNLKIQNLLKKGMFPEAHSIAVSAKFPKEIQAEICKEHADTLYNQKKEYDQALEQYINTIGYLNPSYVIQRYIEV